MHTILMAVIVCVTQASRPLINGTSSTILWAANNKKLPRRWRIFNYTYTTSTDSQTQVTASLFAFFILVYKRKRLSCISCSLHNAEDVQNVLKCVKIVCLSVHEHFVWTKNSLLCVALYSISPKTWTTFASLLIIPVIIVLVRDRPVLGISRLVEHDFDVISLLG